jgi:hypothetical protein
MAEEKLINNEINVAQLPKGIYILKLITTSNFLITKKIIIEN